MAIGWRWILAIVTAFGGFFGWFLGGLDGFLYALVAFVVADYITGLFCAVHNRALSGKVGWRGIFKKVSIFIMVGVGHMLDTHILAHDHIIRGAIVFFYLSNEGLSLLENAAILGLPIPKKLRDVLEQLRDRDNPRPGNGNIDYMEDENDGI